MSEQNRRVVLAERPSGMVDESTTRLEHIELEPLNEGEALVKVKACGVCHTDLHYREGGINDDFPFLLGHEAAGVVEKVGGNVRGLQRGDHVILSFAPNCGRCRMCTIGQPHLCSGMRSAARALKAGDMFFISYSLFEIPSNLILYRVGARIWIARILIMWGVVAALSGFAHTVHQLYIARFLLGVAEAGYYPGILLYLTYWFRRREQAPVSVSTQAICWKPGW